MKYNKLFTEFINSVNNKEDMAKFIRKYNLRYGYAPETSKIKKPTIDTVKGWYKKYISETE